MSRDEQPTNTFPHRRSVLAATATAVASAGCLSSPFGGPGDGDGDADEEDQDDSGTSSTEPPDEGEADDTEDVVDEERNEREDEPAGEEDEDEEQEDQDESSPTLGAYEDHAYGYEIQHPKSWELAREDEQLVTFDEPDGDGELAITIYLAEGDPSLEDGADMVIETTGDELNDVDVRDREQIALDSETADSAVRLVIDYTHPEHGEMRSRHRLVVIDHVLYAVKLAVPLDEWEQREGLAEAVITSLAITDPPSASATDDILADRETYDDEEFSIEYPTEWTVEERDSGDVHFQAEEARAGMVVANQTSQNQPLSEFVESYQDDIELNPDATIVDQHDDLEAVNGNDAHLLVAELDNGETTARTFGLTTVGDGVVYYVTLEIPEPAHTTAAEEEIVTILTSLSF